MRHKRKKMLHTIYDTIRVFYGFSYVSQRAYVCLKRFTIFGEGEGYLNNVLKINKRVNLSSSVLARKYVVSISSVLISCRREAIVYGCHTYISFERNIILRRV